MKKCIEDIFRPNNFKDEHDKMLELIENLLNYRLLRISGFYEKIGFCGSNVLLLRG